MRRLRGVETFIQGAIQGKLFLVIFGLYYDSLLQGITVGSVARYAYLRLGIERDAGHCEYS